MTDPKIDPIDPEDEINQQRKAEHEEAQEDKGAVGAAEGVMDALVRPFTRDKLTEEEAKAQAEETDREERPS
jgi:hypothetical protein